MSGNTVGTELVFDGAEVVTWKQDKVLFCSGCEMCCVEFFGR